MSRQIINRKGGGGGGILQQFIVVGTTSDPTTTSSADPPTVTLAEMTKTFTPLEANSLICFDFQCCFANSQKEDEVIFEWDIGGTNETQSRMQLSSPNSAIPTSVSMIAWRDDLPASSVTAKVEWSTPPGAGTVTAQGTIRRIVITEYKAP